MEVVTPDAISPYLSCMSNKKMKAGERFITQGEEGDIAYIIQSGLCTVKLEKDGELYPLGQLSEGDLVGEMAILTGEPRSAHVDAETDIELWGLNRALFDEISKRDPELLNFITELVTDRLESNRRTADKAIGKYIATDIIGRGGYSIVYKGVHTDLNRPAAIKMLKHNLATDSDFLSSFRSEAQTIASLNHENIIRVYDIEELYRTIFIIVEHLEGETVDDLLGRSKTIPMRRIVDFLIQICSGLSYAHERGIVHQDIKPANLFVQPGDRVKILDFGLACPRGTEDKDLAGTPSYMAPEQIEGRTLDQRTDMYALGITAYEMLTGTRPFPEDDLVALEEMHLNQEIPDPAALIQDVPKALRRFILKASRRDPCQRYQDAYQAIEDLQPLAEEFGLINKYLTQEKRKMTTLFLFYKDEHQLALNQLMEEFSDKAKELGVTLTARDISDI
jgi:serine/threonine protein kinase